MSNKQQEMEQKIADIRKVIDDNPGAKIKSLRDQLNTSFDELNTLFNEYREENKQIHENELKQKISEIEDRAAKKIVERIEEMDARKKEEIENAKRFAMEKSISEAINVIDQLEIAVGFASKDPAVKNYVSGFKIVLDMFVKWLGQFNVTRIAVKPGEDFDEKRMSALEKVPSSIPKNHVVEIKKSGYMMHDKVIRHASVSVSDGSAATATAKTTPVATTAATAKVAPQQTTQQVAQQQQRVATKATPTTPMPQQVIAPTTVIGATQRIATSSIPTAKVQPTANIQQKPALKK